jgi:hypothetical protein
VRTKKIYLTVVLFLFMMGFLILANHQEAAAAVVEYEANWAVHVDFVGNQPNATLAVDVWEYTDGVETDHLDTTRTLRCFVSNGVAINDSEAIFSGSGRIYCAMPSVRRIVYQMTEGEFIPPLECVSKGGAFAKTEIVLEPNLTGQTRSNPIFTMPDLALEAIMPPPPEPTLATKMRFFVDDRNAFSDQFMANLGLNSLQADFNQVIVGLPPADLIYHPLFYANGTQLSSAPSDINEDLSLSLGQRRLYIGYSPDTGESLYGRIRTLDVDPGCPGIG